MSKYNSLWEYIQKDGSQSFKLTFDEIQRISGTPIDHSFLKYKKELEAYGYQVGKITMKEQTVQFNKIENINIPITVEILSDAADSQLVKLENEFLEKIGVFDNFYVEPLFRKMGIARKLTQAAQNWCRENSLASLTVCCAPCDEKMYQALGFDVPLGKTYAYLA